ncbi:16S rRNA (uracil(1498)-N(3))-methyltransferase [Oceanidesulfovibrio indonesiensis]|uniref:Ribosomal RNA small subunit methyltransferase E n=1 Tax=Oceanidesulfovibrio indonesiensis TaxID=54767 RepID=A0A7M3MBS7_9BACT|nr:16S rRNA (uracil(1498)-N(3))-methyltransferase [Oceanidesulfovibrio indonesiensis]TVM15670.1 16S rRNA (uracil(1498)-N(3))-methyltransferase [Oceanidesulfovibrio indonesiensis]
MRSFYLDSSDWPETPDERLILTGTEAHHASRVIRVKVGEEVRVFDGIGREALAEVDYVGKNRVDLAPREVRVSPPPARSVTLAVAWTKALRRSWLLEKAVELEASAVWFWQADRSQGKIPDEPKETWTAQLVAGAKQCESAWVPALRTFPKGFPEVAAAAAAIPKRFALWEDPHQPRMLTANDLDGPGDILFVLGPEGGFSPKEEALFTDAGSGFVPVSLGRRILRWETAALLCLGLAFWSGS